MDTFQIGDYVEVVRIKQHHELLGRRGVVLQYRTDAIRFDGKRYAGWRISGNIRNSVDREIYWEAHQLKKIQPPDWKVEEREEDEVQS